MSVTAKNVADLALKLIGRVNAAGAVDENRESRYYGMAPAYLTVLQTELAELENTDAPRPVADLSQMLSVSDETALKVMPAGLAMYFSLIDRDSELYNHFSQVYYGSFIPQIKPDENELEDYYGVLDDDSMR